MKKTLLISSLVIIAVLSGVAYRENLDMEWQKHQKKYKQELTRLATTQQEKITADNFQIEMRQIVLPEFNKADRCITCHVGMEDTRMRNMPLPLTTHPGNYLETHDINKVGCTFCHDGQGRAITAEDAHAQDLHKYWEKPILKEPFIESTCVRCHLNKLEQAPNYNYGKQLFKDMGCISCHMINGRGANVGPDLSDIGDASFYVKAPIPDNREEYLEKFHANVNLAYLYESVTTPKAQPAETTMPDFGLKDAEKEALALITFLKSLSTKRRVMDVGVDISPISDIFPKTAPAAAPSPDTSTMGSPAATTEQLIDDIEAMGPREVTKEDIAKGRDLFQGTHRLFNSGPACVSCHNVRNDTILIGGGSLGEDLTNTFSMLGKEGLKTVLRDPPTSIMKATYKYKPLTEDEVFVLTAFLEKVDQNKDQYEPRGYTLKLMGNGILGVLVFLGIYTFFWNRRRKD